ncbi:MAG: OmpA family protein [Herminiimonas sp.]|nr:OmpA family protein [Herminiimonas sp.]
MRKFISFEGDTEHVEGAGANRWVVSYADFMTLLFVLFLVLYAKLPKQPEAPFPRMPTKETGMIPGIRARPPQPQAKVAAATPVVASVKQQGVLEDLARSLGDLVEAGDLTLVMRPDGVLLEIKDTALFASGTAQYALKAGAIIAKISEVLETGNNLVVVEGHTDSIAIKTPQFPSNWELSSARAASIVRALQERGVVSTRLTASGLADTRPKSPNDTVEGRRENRRVSLLILNN